MNHIILLIAIRNTNTKHCTEQNMRIPGFIYYLTLNNNVIYFIV